VNGAERRKKMNKNKKKPLKDSISILLACGGCGYCCSGGSVVEKDRTKL
jgi:hypothetical protein